MQQISTLYGKMIEECQSIAGKSFEQHSPIISSNHSSIEDYNLWATVLTDRPEISMITTALREYQLSLLANVVGLYNLAFTGLRFFFERMLTAILFSGKEIELRLWLAGGRDIYWSEISDKDNGVFSHKFCNAFYKDLKDEVPHFQALAIKVYRECSEYVHGNNSVQSKVPSTLEFNAALLNEFQEKADTIKTVLTFIFCLRHLPYLSQEQLQTIEPIVTEELSHIESIRSYFLQQTN